MTNAAVYPTKIWPVLQFILSRKYALKYKPQMPFLSWKVGAHWQICSSQMEFSSLHSPVLPHREPRLRWGTERVYLLGAYYENEVTPQSWTTVISLIAVWILTTLALFSIVTRITLAKSLRTHRVDVLAQTAWQAWSVSWSFFRLGHCTDRQVE